MNILETYYTYSKLSQAAYIDLSGEATPKDGQTIANTGNNQGRLPQFLGNQMFIGSDAWTMLSPYYRSSAGTGHSDPASGFAAMLLSNQTYGKVLAIAGTEPDQPGQFAQDLIEADIGQIGLLGVAFKQLVSLFNYVQELKAPAGATNVLRLEVKVTGAPPPAGVSYVTQTVTLFPASVQYWWLDAKYDGPGTGAIGAGEKLTVTGHSLGGHLAALAVALFPDLFTTAYTFNAPGYNPATTALLAQAPGADAALSLFSQFGAAPLTVSSIVNRVTTLESEDAIPGDDSEGVSSNATGTPFSPERYITTEKVSHDIGHLMDGLALQSLMGRMNAALTPEQAGSILMATTATTGESYELLLEKLYRAIKGTSVTLARTEPGPAMIDGGDFNIRNAFYEKFLELEAAVKANPSLQLASLTNASRDTLVTKAQQTDAEGLATRYALKELNPFAVIGANYTPHNQNGELDLYDPLSGTGNLTDLYLQDRAAFLIWRNKINTDDLSDNVAPRFQDGAWHFKDEATGIQAWAGNKYSVKSDPGLREVLFGTTGADNLTGSDNGDHLYGGAGDDVLTAGKGADTLEGQLGNDTLKGEAGRDTLLGGQGADTLEGGAGADRLEGGQGNDRYVLKSSEPSNDIIVDIDGAGAIELDDTPLTGGDPVSGVQGKWTRDGVTYSFTPDINGEGDLTIQSGAGLTTVRRFKNGQLGIQLGEASTNKPAPSVDLNLKGDLTPIDFDLNQDGVQERYDALGNVIVDPGLPAPGRGDRLFGSAGDDVIEGLAGSDYIESHGGDDKLLGGEGADVLLGGGAHRARTRYMGNFAMTLGWRTTMRAKDFSGVGVESGEWKGAA